MLKGICKTSLGLVERLIAVLFITTPSHYDREKHGPIPQKPQHQQGYGLVFDTGNTQGDDALLKRSSPPPLLESLMALLRIYAIDGRGAG